MIAKPTPSQVRNAQDAAGLTSAQCAEIFGYSKAGWDKKLQSGASSRSLSIGEYAYLLLIAGQHPEYELVRK